MSNDMTEPPVFQPAPNIVAHDTLPFEVAVLRDLAITAQAAIALTSEMAWLRDRHTLIQGQLAVMERQMDTIVALIAKIGVASFPQEARAITEKDAIDKTEEWIKKRQEEEDKWIEARGGDHPPTPEELAAAQAEALR